MDVPALFSGFDRLSVPLTSELYHVCIRAVPNLDMTPRHIVSIHVGVFVV